VEMASTSTARLMPFSRSNRSSMVINSEFIKSLCLGVKTMKRAGAR
jgi:hypothetical protein